MAEYLECLVFIHENLVQTAVSFDVMITMNLKEYILVEKKTTSHNSNYPYYIRIWPNNYIRVMAFFQDIVGKQAPER